MIEALLFSAGRVLDADDIAKLTGEKDKKKIAKAAAAIMKDYSDRDSPMLITEESGGWKMTIRETYLQLVRSINPHTELSKTMMETLAVIAWKSPVLQSTVIKIRTNKAYDHITELEDLGFITRDKYGRSFMLKLTQKFFDYFDLKDRKDIAKVFKDIGEMDEQTTVEDFESSDDDVPEDPGVPEDEEKMLDEISRLEAKGGDDSVIENLGEIHPDETHPADPSIDGDGKKDDDTK